MPAENVDTDQIIPARFLKVTDKKGLGDNLFCDWRYNEDGSPKTFELLARGAVDRGKGGVGIWWLFADEEQIRRKGQAPQKGMKDEAWPGHRSDMDDPREED